MRLINPACIPELSWTRASELLSVSGGDIIGACYAVQREWLQPVYKSISSEHKKLKVEEMAEIKSILSRNDAGFSNEVRAMNNLTLLFPYIIKVPRLHTYG